jgi:5-methylcytosine-specific restriction endonuclease McrA
MSVPGWLRKEVVTRAGQRCEYCRLSQAGQEAVFHVDHILPVVEGGETALENLALACVSCSLRKGARLHGRDPRTGREVTIFHLVRRHGKITLHGKATIG